MKSITGQMIAYGYKAVRASTPHRANQSSHDQWEALGEHMLRFVLEARLDDGSSSARKVMSGLFGTDLEFDSVFVSQQSTYSDGRPDLALSALLDSVEVARLLIELKVRADFTDIDGRHQIARYLDELGRLVDSVLHRGLVVIAPTKGQLDDATKVYKNENRNWTPECQQIKFRALRWDKMPTLFDAIPSEEVEVRAAVDALAEFGQVNLGAVLPNPGPATTLLNGEIAELFSREFAFATRLSQIARGHCLRLYGGQDSGTWLMSGLSNNKSCSKRWGVEFDPTEPTLRAWLGHRCRKHFVWARIAGAENDWAVPEGDDLRSWWETDHRVKLACNSDYPGDEVVSELHKLYELLRDAQLDVPDWPADPQTMRAFAEAGHAIWHLLMEARAALTESEPPEAVQGQGTFGWTNRHATIIVDRQAWAEDPASGPFRINGEAMPPNEDESFVHYAARLRSTLDDR